MAGRLVAGAGFGFALLTLFQTSSLVAVVSGATTALALVLFAIFKAEFPLGEASAVAGSMFAGLCLASAFAYLKYELPVAERAEKVFAQYKLFAADGDSSLAQSFELGRQLR